MRTIDVVSFVLLGVFFVGTSAAWFITFWVVSHYDKNKRRKQ